MARMSSAPSVSSSITVRLQVQARPTAISDLTTCIEQAGGMVTALDITRSEHERIGVDVTCATRGENHAQSIVEALRGLEGITVERVSDRTFLMHLGGKLSVESKVPLRNRDDLSMAYTPGVARVCEAIAARPEDARNLTIKRNTIAVVTDGTAVLGLGDIGPLAALPVMEGKAVLFKRFAGIDAFPIALDTTDVDEIVDTVCAIAPVFAGINLEDISAPRCFEVERRLRERLDIPVFHDDQHGTAIVALAALMNALKVVGKDLGEVRIVMSGAGAAGTAVLKLLLAAGARDVVVCDVEGVVHVARPGLHESLLWTAQHTNPRGLSGTLKEAVVGEDLLRLRPVGEEPDGGHRQPADLTDPAGERYLVARPDGDVGEDVPAAGDVDEVGAERAEDGRHRGDVLHRQAAVDPVRRGDAHEQGLVVRPHRTHRRHDLAEQAGTVLGGPAVRVGAVVGQR